MAHMKTLDWMGIQTSLATIRVAEQALREEPYERLPYLAGGLAIAALRIEHLCERLDSARAENERLKAELHGPTNKELAS